MTYTPLHKKTTLPKKEYQRILLLRTLGNFLILYSLYMMGWVFLNPLKEEIKYTYTRILGKRYITAEEAQFELQKKEADGNITEHLSDLLKNQNLEVIVPKDPEFSIVIPKLGANSNILANIDPGNEQIYLDALHKGVAHAAGTGFPGENRHIYLFAHSTNTFSNVSRYNAIFYLLYKLENQDEIDIYYRGARYKYHVIGKKIVDPSEVGYLTRTTPGEFLTLQTCWPPGTVAKRLLIFADKSN